MAAVDIKPVIRLSNDIIPTLYDVALIPRLDSFTFAGQVYIDIRVNKPSSAIILHALDQTIDSVIINKIDAGKTGVEVSSFSLNEEKQTLTIETKSVLEVGDYRLSIVFNGILNDKLAGFYRSSYVSQNGDKKFLAVTQFEAADARRALPCFDEPLFKAVWRVTLIVDKQYTALSNMPVKERTTLMATPAQVTASPSSYENISAYQSLLSRGLMKWDSEMVHYTYQDSPIMSSYLLAFCVGEFDYLSAFTVADATSPSVEVRIYTTPGKNQLGHFALDVAVRSLQFYNQWFGIPYPLPKVDLIAIPDFAAGAMENWGLITYREQALLIDPEHSSALVKQRACRTICHELAHMWFGNLVTMEWWQYLWLNEGFARFTEHLAADHLFPQWQLWTQFGQDTYALAQGLDALESSHPIEVTVHSSDEANEIFDTISYAKGASVIRMLYDAIGHETFQAGIRLYLKKFSYKNTVSEDLWDSLTEATQNKVNIRQLMDHWVKHDGYPVLRLDDGVVNPNGRRCFHYHQQRFLVSGNSDEKKEASHWNIPFTAAYFNTKGDNGTPETTKLILDKKDGEFEVEEKSDKIIKLNHQHTSFIRVQYSHAHFASLSSIVNTMPAPDRLGLQRDAYALAASGRIPIADALDLIVHYSKENDYSVVAALSTSLQSLSAVHANESYFPLLQKFIGYLYRTNYHAVGWDAKPDDSHLTALLRQNVISMMSLADDIEVKQEALRRIRAYVVDEKNAIGADLRSIVYQSTAKALGKEGREILLSIYSKATMAEEKGRVLSAIGHIDGKSSDATELIQSAVDFIFGDSVRTGDIHFAMASLASSKFGQQFIWNYIKTNWSAIIQRFAKMGFVLGYVLSAALSHFSTHADASDVEEFFAKNSCPAERTVKQSVEAIRSRANRLEREKNQVEAWLKKNEANFV